MIHNGHLVHPDIWMLWFSFFVSLRWAIAFVVRMTIWTVLYWRKNWK